jgi:hypothetical protein
LAGFTGRNPKMQLDLEAMLVTPKDTAKNSAEEVDKDNKGGEDAEMQGDKTTDKAKSDKTPVEKEANKVDEDPETSLYSSNP